MLFRVLTIAYLGILTPSLGVSAPDSTGRPTKDALLAAVAASPDDDLPRLVFADWLDENGEPERAEFIRAQIELARQLDTQTQTSQTLLARAKFLHHTHHATWGPPLPTGVTRSSKDFGAFHRGFRTSFELVLDHEQQRRPPIDINNLKDSGNVLTHGTVTINTLEGLREFEREWLPRLPHLSHFSFRVDLHVPADESVERYVRNCEFEFRRIISSPNFSKIRHLEFLGPAVLYKHLLAQPLPNLLSFVGNLRCIHRSNLKSIFEAKRTNWPQILAVDLLITGSPRLEDALDAELVRLLNSESVSDFASLRIIYLDHISDSLRRPGNRPQFFDAIANSPFIRTIDPVVYELPSADSKKAKFATVVPDEGHYEPVGTSAEAWKERSHGCHKVYGDVLPRGFDPKESTRPKWSSVFGHM